MNKINKKIIFFTFFGCLSPIILLLAKNKKNNHRHLPKRNFVKKDCSENNSLFSFGIILGIILLIIFMGIIIFIFIFQKKRKNRKNNVHIIDRKKIIKKNKKINKKIFNNNINNYFESNEVISFERDKNNKFYPLYLGIKVDEKKNEMQILFGNHLFNDKFFNTLWVLDITDNKHRQEGDLYKKIYDELETKKNNIEAIFKTLYPIYDLINYQFLTFANNHKNVFFEKSIVLDMTKKFNDFQLQNKDKKLTDQPIVFQTFPLTHQGKSSFVTPNMPGNYQAPLPIDYFKSAITKGDILYLDEKENVFCEHLSIFINFIYQLVNDLINFFNCLRGFEGNAKKLANILETFIDQLEMLN